MTAITLTVNGAAVRELVAPRTHLADFLRERLLLTGTHLGCEHGVCGACTVLIDGAPARACIAFAAALDGARVDTIEGLEHDPAIVRLREAFSAEHALQCGYCTPGMLVTGRDIVLRLPDADEARVRLELAGNLCRCTGYAGIVRAILRVLGEADDVRRAAASPFPSWEGLGEGADRSEVAVAAPPSLPATTSEATLRQPAGTELVQNLRIAAPLDAVWRALRDPALVAGCVPGVRLTEIADGRIAGEMLASLGPIRARFAGGARIEYGPGHTGRIEGEGRDGGSRLSATAVFALRADGPDATVLALTITYALRGPLAQFSRGPVVRAFAGEIAATVAAALSAKLTGDTAPPRPGVIGLLLRVLRRWLS
jgi:carbon-monoxide dehydrogenase small subunit